MSTTQTTEREQVYARFQMRRCPCGELVTFGTGCARCARLQDDEHPLVRASVFDTINRVRSGETLRLR